MVNRDLSGLWEVGEAVRFGRVKADMTAQDTTSEGQVSKFNIQGVPTTRLIDSAGKVRERKVGYVGARELFTALRQVN